MIKLYFNPRSRAVTSRWMLDECGADYELVHIDFEKREQKGPEFLAINPAGKLPALVDGDTRLFETAAIIIYLADKFPEAKLAPAIDAPERGRYLSLIVYSVAQAEPAMGDVLLKIPPSSSRGWTDWETSLDVMEKELGDGPYLFGDWFTAADVSIGSLLSWRQMFAGPTGRPTLDAYVKRLSERPHAMKMG